MFAAGFHQRLTKPATDALGPINVTTTRGAVITAAGGTRLTHHLFAKLLTLGKSPSYAWALGVPLSHLRAL